MYPILNLNLSHGPDEFPVRYITLRSTVAGANVRLPLKDLIEMQSKSHEETLLHTALTKYNIHLHKHLFETIHATYSIINF